MNKYMKSIAILIFLLSAVCSADVFRHRTSDEVFYGYPTQRTSREKTQIYAYENEKFVGRSINIDEYNVEYSSLGRKKNVIVIGITHQEMILSSTVSKLISKTIVEASNKGPLFILLEIDSPGGRGDYMKGLCETIDKTNNCPVIAFITSGEHGGAYSAAAGVALTCDKIYMTPQAMLATVSPLAISTNTEAENRFSPANIGSYGVFLKTVAEKKNRPGTIAAAMVDKYIEVVEVIVDQEGTRKFVNRSDKRPADVVVRTLSRKSNPIYSGGVYTGSDNSNATAQQSSFFETSLTARDAVYAKIADAIVLSREEVIADLGATHAKVIPTSRIKKEAMNFAKNRRVVENLFANIDDLQSQVGEIEDQLEHVSAEGEENRIRRKEEQLKNLEKGYYEDRKNMYKRNESLWESDRINKVKNNRSKNNVIRDSYVDPYLIEYDRLRRELAYVLDRMIGKYKGIIKIGKKYPGTIPVDQTIRSIEQQLNSVMIKRRSRLFG